jgi:hypothetical protein
MSFCEASVAGKLLFAILGYKSQYAIKDMTSLKIDTSIYGHKILRGFTKVNCKVVRVIY